MSASSWVHRNLFWQLSRDGNSHGSGMSHAMTAYLEPFFRAPGRLDDGVVGRGNYGRTISKSRHPGPCQRELIHIFYLEHKTNDWVWSKFHFVVGPQEHLLATVKRRKFAWFGHVTRHDSLSKSTLQGTLEVGDAVVGRGNAGWTTPKSGHNGPCQNRSQGPPAEKTGRGPLLNRPSCPPDDPVGKGTELN